MWSPVQEKMAVLSWSAWCWVVWWLGFWFWCTRWCNGCFFEITRPLTANFRSWLAQTRLWARDDQRGLQGSGIRDTSSAKLRRYRPTHPTFSNGASGKCNRLCPRVKYFYIVTTLCMYLEIVCIICVGQMLGFVGLFEVKRMAKKIIRMSQLRIIYFLIKITWNYLSVFGVHFCQFSIVLQLAKLSMIQTNFTLLNELGDPTLRQWIVIPTHNY